MFAVATVISAVFSPSVASECHAIDQINDATLQHTLQSKLKQNNRMKRLIDNKKFWVCLIDMQRDSPKSVGINGNHMVYAGSQPTIAILFAAYASLEGGSLIQTPEIKNDLVRVSSNSAATRMIDRIDLDKTRALLQDTKY